MLLVGAILPLQSLEVVDLYLQSKTKISLSVRVRLFSFFILTFIKLTFIYCKIDIEYFIMLAVVESVFIGLGYWRILVNIFGLKMFKDIDVKYGINLISEGWPIAVSGLLMWIGYRADQIIVGHFLDIESVGLYAAILPFSTAWQFIPVMLTSVFSNKIYKLKLNSASAYKDAMFKIISVYTILSFLICIFTYCIADWLMDSIYGESLAGASILLKIHVWTNLFISINLALNIKSKSIFLICLSFKKC
jgi:PST family polysaccharide transporter